MRTSSQIAINAISKWLGLIVSTVVGIVVVPIMIDQFGKEGYGLIGICMALLALRIIIDFGLQAAVTRQLAAVKAEKDHEQYNNVISSALAIYMALGCITALTAILLAPLIATGLNIPTQFYSEGIFLIRYYAGSTFFLAFLTAPLASILSSNNRFDLLNYVEAATQILRGVGVLTVLTITPWGFYGWAGANIFASIVNLIIILIFANRVGPPLRISVRRMKFRHLPLRTSFHTFLLALSQEVSTTSDTFVLSSIMGPAAVGLYQPGRLLSRRIRPLVDAIKNQLHPLATERYTQGRMEQVRAILIEGTKYRLLMGIGTCVGLGAFAPELTQVWLGNILNTEDLHTVALVMLFWAITDLFTYAGGSQWPVLFGMNAFPFLVRLSLPLALLNISVSIIFVKYTPWGIMGVIIPTMCIEAIRVVITYGYCCRLCKFTYREYFQKAYIRPLIVLIILVTVAVCTRLSISPVSLTALCFCAVINGIVWVLLCYRVGLYPEDRQRLLEMIYSSLEKIPFLKKTFSQ